MKVIRIAQVPPPTIEAGSCVRDALARMKEVQGGACVVMEEDSMVGMFSERDLMLRVGYNGSQGYHVKLRSSLSSLVWNQCQRTTLHKETFASSGKMEVS